MQRNSVVLNQVEDWWDQWLFSSIFALFEIWWNEAGWI